MSPAPGYSAGPRDEAVWTESVAEETGGEGSSSRDGLRRLKMRAGDKWGRLRPRERMRHAVVFFASLFCVMFTF